MRNKTKEINISFSILWGVKAGILMMLLTFILFIITGSNYRPVPIWNHILLLILLFISINKLKHKLFKGYLSFKQCYISGLITGIVVALMFGIFMFFHTIYIDKELIANNIAANEKALSQYLSGIELQNKIKDLHQNTTSLTIAIKSTFEILLMSLFLPLLVSIFLKKDKSNNRGKSEVVEIE